MESLNTKADSLAKSRLYKCRDGGIRTHDLLHPMQARDYYELRSWLRFVIVSQGFMFLRSCNR